MVILDSQKTNMAIPCLSQIEVGKAESQVCEIEKFLEKSKFYTKSAWSAYLF